MAGGKKNQKCTVTGATKHVAKNAAEGAGLGAVAGFFGGPGAVIAGAEIGIFVGGAKALFDIGKTVVTGKCDI